MALFFCRCAEQKLLPKVIKLSVLLSECASHQPLDGMAWPWVYKEQFDQRIMLCTYSKKKKKKKIKKITNYISCNQWSGRKRRNVRSAAAPVQTQQQLGDTLASPSQLAQLNDCLNVCRAKKKGSPH